MAGGGARLTPWRAPVEEGAPALALDDDGRRVPSAVGAGPVATGGLAGAGPTFFGPSVPPFAALGVLALGVNLLRAAGRAPLPSSA